MLSECFCFMVAAILIKQVLHSVGTLMPETGSGNDYLDGDRISDDEAYDAFVKPEANAHEPPGINDSGRGLSTGDSEILEPRTGMTFLSLDDARDFYYEYAKRTGFTLRTNRIRHSLKNMAIIGRDFVCSREGFRAAKHMLRKDRVLPPRPVTREGCKAMIRLAARDGGTWIVTKFVREHNHKLMNNCKFPGELPIVNILSEVCSNYLAKNSINFLSDYFYWCESDLGTAELFLWILLYYLCP